METVTVSSSKREFSIVCRQSHGKLWIEFVRPRKDGEHSYTTKGVKPEASVGIVDKYMENKRWDVLARALELFIQDLAEKNLIQDVTAKEAK